MLLNWFGCGGGQLRWRQTALQPQDQVLQLELEVLAFQRLLGLLVGEFLCVLRLLVSQFQFQSQDALRQTIKFRQRIFISDEKPFQFLVVAFEAG